MAKTIKFNLICDGKPVRNIEDLQNNFSIEDVLAYYENKLLHRWLKVRGFEKELAAVNAITEEKPIDIIKSLIKIFNVETDEKKVAESIYMLEYLDERKELCSIYEKDECKVKHIIDYYQTGYRNLIDRILQNKDDISIIKSAISEIDLNYRWVFNLDHRNLFYILKKYAPMAIFCMLMNENMRNYYLPVKLGETDSEEVQDDNPDMFAEICELIDEKELKGILLDNLKIFSGVTDGYWKDLEPKDKKIMVLSINSGDYVRAAGQLGGDLAYTDIKDNFSILDGIDYKSNLKSRSKILYMEV